VIVRRSVLIALALALSGAAAACSHVSAVRLQEETVEVGPGLRPLAAIQANAISAYFLFLPLPGVDLDRAVNRLLISTAKIMGADKVVLLDFDVTPDGGIWALRKLLGWRSARATGIAVQVTTPAEDPRADEGPEPAPAAPQQQPPPAASPDQPIKPVKPPPR
jgi:hypothetical protein